MKDKVLHVLDVIEGYLLAVPFVLLCVFIVIDIVLLKFFQSGFPWLEEFGRYVLVFGTFLGASMAVRTDDHPRMTALLVAVPHTVRQILKIVGDLICIAGLAVVDYFSWLQIASMVRIGTMTSTLPVPLWVGYIIIPIALCTMAIRYVFETVKDVKLLIHPPAKDAPAVEGGEA